MEQGQRIAGTYEAAMGSAGKQLRSIPRYIYETLLAIGQPFQDAFGSVVFSISDAVKQVQSFVSEGGALFPLFQNLGAVAAVIGESFGNVVRGLVGIRQEAVRAAEDMDAAMRGGVASMQRASQEGFNTWLTSLANTLQQGASSALTWGIEISTQLATGLVQGAAAAITAAMNAISGLLTFWLGPGSPPRVAPELAEWGAAWMTEILEGFSQADYDVLGGVQRQLSTALDTLVNLGELTEDAVGDTYASVSYQLMAALDQFNQTGVMSTQIFDDLVEVGGDFGQELADLLGMELDLAVATAKAAEAQQDLNDAQAAEMAYDQLLADLGVLRAEYAVVQSEGIEAASAQETAARTQVDAVQALVREYQALAAAGADTSLLAAKEAEIEATMTAADASVGAHQQTVAATDAALDALEGQIDAKEDEVDAAEAAAQAAQAQIDAAQATYDLAMMEVNAAQEKVDLQNQLLDQVFGITDAQADSLAITDDIAGALGAAAGGAGGLSDALAGAMDMAGGLAGAGESVVSAFDVLKEQVRDKLAEAFEPVRVLWEETLPKALAPLQEAWDGLMGDMRRVYDEKIQPIVDGIKDVLPDDFLVKLGQVAGVVLAADLAFRLLGLSLAIVATLVSAITSPIALIVGAVALLYVAWTENWFGIQDVTTRVWEKHIKPAVEGIKKWFEKNWPIIQAVFLTAWTVIQDVATVVANIFTNSIMPSIQGALENISAAMESLGIDWEAIWGWLGDIVMTIGALIGGNLLLVVGIIVSAFETVAEVIAYVTGVWAQMAESVRLIIEGLSNIIGGAMALIKGIITGDTDLIRESFKANFEGVKQIVEGVFGFISSWISLTLGTVIKTVGGFVENLIFFFVDLYEQLVGGSIIPELMEGMLGLFVDTLEDLWLYWKEKWTDILDTLRNIVSDILATIRTWLSDVWQTVTTTFNDIVIFLQGLYGSAVDAGKAFIQGLIDGIGQMTDALWNAVMAVAQSVIDWLFSKWGIPTGGGGEEKAALAEILGSYGNLPATAMPGLALATSPATEGAALLPSTLIVYGDVTVEGVQDTSSLMAELQELAL